MLMSCAKTFLSENVVGTDATALPLLPHIVLPVLRAGKRTKEGGHGKKAAGQTNKDECHEVGTDKKACSVLCDLVSHENSHEPAAVEVFAWNKASRFYATRRCQHICC